MIPTGKFARLSPSQKRRLYLMIIKEYLPCPPYPVFAAINVLTSYVITPDKADHIFLPFFFGLTCSLIFWWTAEIIGKKI